uniref:(S)-2-hydroxy-acid oxidase n=1 Tax=Erpetoichthys calabaricus TaxID=27687 RepID=A0A8C4SNZ4_ERPCA
MSQKPVCVKDFEEHARRVLPKSIYDYYRSGADDQITLADNQAAFSRWRLYPRVLREVSHVDISTTVLGQKVSMPVCVAATAMQRMAHPDGEIATVKACQSAGIGMMLSSWATTSIDEVAKAAPEAVRWLQLYIYKDRELTKSLVLKAEREGYKGIFITVDTPYLGKRRNDIRNRFKLPSHLRMANFEMPDLAFSSKESYGEDSGLAVYVAKLIDPSLRWEDIAWVKSLTRLPVVVKGILRADDAIEAVTYGVDGILVSNHGARQLDCVIVEAVGGRVEVYLDGGVRRYFWDVLSFGGSLMRYEICRGCVGEQGVSEVLELLREEFTLAMALCGMYSRSSLLGGTLNPCMCVSGANFA